MEKEKLERRNIIILFVVTLLLLLAMTLGWYFGLVKPVEAQRAAALRDYEARKAIADRLETAQIDQRKAEDRLVEVTGQVQFFRRLYRSLEFGAMGNDPASEDIVQKAERERTWRAWLREYFTDYAAAFTATLDARARQSGVEIERSIRVDKPPQTPEEVAAPPNGFLKPAVGSGTAQGGGGLPGGGAPISAVSMSPGGGRGGTGGAASSGSIPVRATGTLPQLIDFFQRLNNSPILMVVENIRLDSTLGGTNTQSGLGTTGLSTGALGTAGQPQRRSLDGVPKVTATFNVVPYLLARGPGANITSTSGAVTSTASTGSGLGGAPNASLVGAPSMGGARGGNGVTP